jgi:hypothetical protein
MPQVVVVVVVVVHRWRLQQAAIELVVLVAVQVSRQSAWPSPSRQGR